MPHLVHDDVEPVASRQVRGTPPLVHRDGELATSASKRDVCPAEHRENYAEARGKRLRILRFIGS